jgi:hypothetical protein
MNQQGAQVAIAPLADPEQHRMMSAPLLELSSSFIVS